MSPYITLDAHSRIPELQLCSQHTWEKLSEEYRLIIRRCAQESALYERELWAQTEQEARAKLAGECVVTELSADELARFREAVQPIYTQYAAGHADFVRRIRTQGEE